MKARLTIFCLLSVVLVAPLKLFAQEKETKLSVRVQVMLLETTGNVDSKTRSLLSGPSDSVSDTIRELVKGGSAAIVNHADMTVIEQSESVLQIGETIARVNGTSRMAGGREIRNYQDVEVGTIVQIRSQVEEGDVVLMDIDVTKSYLAGGDEESGTPAGIAQLTNQSTVQIKDGNAQLIGSMIARGSGDDLKGVHVVVMADILKGSEIKQATRFRSFPSPTARRTADAGQSSDARSSSDARRPRGFGPPQGASSRSSARPSQEDMRVRVTDGLFTRADSDGDGVISESELSSLRWRARDAKAPITKAEYKKWAAENWPPTRETMFSSSGSSQRGRPSRSSRTRPSSEDDNEAEEDSDAEDEDDEDEDDDDE